MNQLMDHTCSGDHLHLINEDFNAGELPKLSDQLIKDIYENKIPKSQIPEQLYFETAKIMNGGIKEVLGNYSYESGTNSLASIMRSQIYAFSSAKNQTMAFEMRDALLDSNGKVKSFNRFQVDAKRISGKYVKDWLNAEYNTAISSAQMGRKWQEIQDSKEVYQFLIYRTVGDGRVSDEHAVLEGLKLKVDDPRWNSIFPPNRFNCRCSVDQSDNKKGLTTDDDANARMKAAKVRKNFKRNSGKEGLQFLDDTYNTRLIEADGRLEQLGAVKHYGMRTLKSIYSKGKKPSLGPLKNKKELDLWFQKQIDLNPDIDKSGFIIDSNIDGRKIHLNSSLKDKLLKEERLYANQIDSVINNADEIWTVKKGSTKFPDEIFTTYSKHFDDGVYSAIVSTKQGKEGVKIKSFYKHKSLENAEEFRRGILEYKNRKIYTKKR